MPRTTLDIDASVLRELKAVSARDHKPLGRVVSELLASALSRRGEEPPPREFWWPTTTGGMLIDIDDKEALWEMFDRETMDLDS